MATRSTADEATKSRDTRQGSAAEAEIRQRIDTLVEAIGAMDLDTVMSMYAPDVVSFDIEPPLQHVGAAAKRNNWWNVFSIYQRPLSYEIRDLTLTVGDDVAFGHGFIRIAGTLKSGTRTERWLRATMCFRKIAGTWRIAHDQVSAPLDLESGKALLNLEP
jgi:ketosteroid isomerase-like protein